MVNIIYCLPAAELGVAGPGSAGTLGDDNPGKLWFFAG